MRLLILGKDGTLTKSKSGATFVQHPEDQELLPGVEEAIARYAADGWAMAIASNQGGCMWTKTPAMSCPTPGYIRHDGEIIKVESKYSSDYKTYFFQEGQAESVFFVAKTELLEFCYKTVEDAIAEMQYCLKLLPAIAEGVFCPDDGQTLILCDCLDSLDISNSYGLRASALSGTFRKPQPGMLNYLRMTRAASLHELKTGCLDAVPQWPILYVGDRPEDEAAAQAANVPFMWADVWRG